ncbi:MULTISPECIES: methionine ABC transporter ATP-binding protein [unclassified Aureimonas]|uniref:methionine ABC transporter ATP-binding protein n=1 Tax=unclassified Aureimonas TaxID=2615206 RepID=UPI0006F20928|nr:MULTISPECIES: methionine ABC transporter ATP-binding protein [unclassified Aureimonas]KQT60488.1 methionine ABC transporter ATP-binding protein [Aureimonas sp. Leaf427]KQT79365.1 methionine ABC transporter ATP-binding protein [Aureimonas sp. Leaf460]
MNQIPTPSEFGGRAAAEPDDLVVRLSGVSRRFGAVQALDGISLDVRRGEIVGIIGRSGAGKSTLIRCLNGLERPDAGRVEIEGVEISRLGERALQPLRRRVGMVFQHFNLLSAKTVEENVALPLKIEGLGSAERRRRAAELLDLVGLTEKARSYPSELSGGQKQRVGIARALAARPALLLCDEATSALDPETTRSILALLKEINARLGLTILLITHEMEVVRSIADRVAVIDRGRIVEEGPVWQVFAAPEAPTTRSLLGGLRPGLPAHIAEKLDAGPGGLTVLRIDATGPAARLPFLERLGSASNGAARLLHGGIDHSGDQPVATLFVGLSPSGPDPLETALSSLRASGAIVEVLGHVPNDV